jgi:hypothetical protein
MGMVGKARPATVKKRVRTWELFSRWLMWRRGRVWPSSAVDLVDYIHEKVAEGCFASFPEVFRAAVSWMESRSGLPDGQRFSQDGFFRRNVDRALVVAVRGAESVKKAPRFPLSVVAALEVQVMDRGLPVVVRIVTWMRLLKVFGVLRSDDILRLRPGDVSLRESGLSGKLAQTKTTGAGKKVRELPLFVPRGMFVVEDGWLGEGHRLWSALPRPGRDYFLPRPRQDLQSFYDCPASSGDMAVLYRYVLTLLKVPVRADGEDEFSMEGGASGWARGETLLLIPPLDAGWTGHSERSTLPSIFAAAGVPKSERDPLGRWSPSGSDDYVRTYRSLVKGLAARFRSLVMAGAIFDALDEDDAISDVVSIIEGKLEGEGAKVKEAGQALVVLSKTFYQALAAAAGDVRAGPPSAAGPAINPEPATGEHVQDEVPAPYLIAMTGHGRILCLHRREGCWRSRALEFRSFEWVDMSPVPEELYTRHCLLCWPGDGPVSGSTAPAPEVCSSGTDDTSTDSTGESEA